MAKQKNPRPDSKKNGNSGDFATAAAPAMALEAKKNVIPINLEDEIRRRAYELFEQRGGTPGTEQEDWVRAEREVLARYKQSA
jgi:Protein of unknown function (DUF2934)